ncbi:helix-turn-helix transcriptional regulator [Rhodococcus sp. BP-241]|uniref:helix-turn-helix domain-containing protein n=1 Tax=Rhodococcus sp. BP-241 TaxID=2739441 RepID=UPI001C9AB930|nr:helix-turn-helix transcriptional regulator [Rhodococcus sp. BP-241]MBY6708484.1 helix-turn-helix transcriptional regulator [Rhodococcus sp. BP-241]
MTEKMTADQVVGQRIADLRQQRALRQDEFLLMLKEAGLTWTRSVLSRVESGLRPLRWTEGISVASALGVDPKELSTEQNALSELERKSHQLRIKRNESLAAKKNAESAIAAANSLLSVLIATMALKADAAASFVVHASPVVFVERLGSALRENPFDEFGPLNSAGEDRDKAYGLLGIVDPDVEWYQTHDGPPEDPDSALMDEYHAQASEFEEVSLLGQFAEKYPNVRFSYHNNAAHVVIDGITFEELDGR